MKVHTTDQLGPIESSYELSTNDPKHPVIKLTIVAEVKPLPSFVKRIASANIARGEADSGFQIWPTSRPVVTLESGERFAITLRIRPLTINAGTVKLAPTAPDSWKLRRDPNGSDYWLDIGIEPSNQSGSRAAPLVIETSDGHSRESRIEITVNVPEENFIVTPREIDFGELQLTSHLVKRVGVRKMVGSFHLRAVSVNLPFLKIEQATMVEGSNYLLRISIDQTRPVKPGAYQGVLLIQTDDGHRAEVAIKLRLIDQ